MKGIVLAGGSGSRLQPVSSVINKHLMPVYDKPMIYYPLSVLMLAGVREIMLISSPQQLPNFQQLLGDGSAFGLRLSYAEQPKPDGVAQALIIGREFIGSSSVMLALGDNIFFGSGLAHVLRRAVSETKGATIFTYSVEDPRRYGVVRFSADGRPLDLIEKPKLPPSHWAVTGLYLYDSRAVDLASSLTPSSRGELEITDLNKAYLSLGDLQVQRLGRGYAWFDTGTHDALLDASGFIRTVQRRQGIQIACLEEIAFANNFIDRTQLRAAGDRLSGTEYGRYLLNLLDTE